MTVAILHILYINLITSLPFFKSTLLYSLTLVFVEHVEYRRLWPFLNILKVSVQRNIVESCLRNLTRKRKG